MREIAYRSKTPESQNPLLGALPLTERPENALPPTGTGPAPKPEAAALRDSALKNCLDAAQKAVSGKTTFPSLMNLADVVNVYAQLGMMQDAEKALGVLIGGVENYSGDKQDRKKISDKLDNARVRIAVAYADSEAWADAERVAASVPKLADDVLAGFALAQLRQGKAEMADETAGKIKKRETQQMAWLNMAVLLALDGKTKEADALIESKITPKDRNGSYADIAIRAAKRGNLDVATVYADRVLQYSKQYSEKDRKVDTSEAFSVTEALIGVAAGYSARGDAKTALRYLYGAEQAAKYSGQLSKTELSIIITALARNGDEAHALEAWDRMPVSMSQEVATTSLSVALAEKGNAKAILKLIGLEAQKLKKAFPNDIDIRTDIDQNVCLALAYAIAGDGAQSEVYLNKAQNWEKVRALASIAEFLPKQADALLGRAREAADAARKNRPDDVDADASMRILMLADAKNGLWPEAEKNAELIVDGTDRADALATLACAYARNEQMADAARMMGMAVTTAEKTERPAALLVAIAVLFANLNVPSSKSTLAMQSAMGID